MWSQWSLGSTYMYPSQSQPKYTFNPPPQPPPSPHPLHTLHYCLKDRCWGRGDSKFSLCGWILTLWPLIAYDHFQSKLEFWACSTWVLNSHKFTKGCYILIFSTENKKLNRVTQTWLFCHGMLTVWMKEIFWKEQEMFAILSTTENLMQCSYKRWSHRL